MKKGIVVKKNVFEADQVKAIHEFIVKNDILFTDAYYTDEFFIYDLNSVNRGFSSFSTAGQILSINNKWN